MYPPPSTSPLVHPLNGQLPFFHERIFYSASSTRYKRISFREQLLLYSVPLWVPREGERERGRERGEQGNSLHLQGNQHQLCCLLPCSEPGPKSPWSSGGCPFSHLLFLCHRTLRYLLLLPPLHIIPRSPTEQWPHPDPATIFPKNYS